MKAAAFVTVGGVRRSPSAIRRHAQLGGLGELKKRRRQGRRRESRKIDDLNITDTGRAAARRAGQREAARRISASIRTRTSRSTSALVGSVLAQASTAPELDWQFIVLDTDGVNAFAAPGGMVHITRGLLGLMKNEAELAGVLGHEITHITEAHTIGCHPEDQGHLARRRRGRWRAGGLRNQSDSKMAGAAFNNDLRRAVQPRATRRRPTRSASSWRTRLGYAPAGMADVLKKIDARNSRSRGPQRLVRVASGHQGPDCTRSRSRSRPRS